MAHADQAELNGGKGEKRKSEARDYGHTGQRERKAGSERPTLGHSPLGWLGANATAHYMLCLSSVDEQCTITLPCCSSSHTASMPLRRLILLLQRLACQQLLRSSDSPYMHSLMQIQVQV